MALKYLPLTICTSPLVFCCLLAPPPPLQGSTFFGDKADGVFRLTVRAGTNTREHASMPLPRFLCPCLLHSPYHTFTPHARTTGQTLLIPPGWFHAVYTPEVN